MGDMAFQRKCMGKMQDVAGAVGLRDVRYGFDGDNHLDAPVDTSNPYFQFDASKCIVCSRCVRACDEVQGTFALTIEGRGFASKVSAGIGEDFLDSECVSCGACVQACPTAAVDLDMQDHLQTLHQAGATKEEVMETLGIATLVGGTIVVPHLRRAYEFWEALEQQG